MNVSVTIERRSNKQDANIKVFPPSKIDMYYHHSPTGIKIDPSVQQAHQFNDVMSKPVECGKVIQNVQTSISSFHQHRSNLKRKITPTYSSGNNINSGGTQSFSPPSSTYSTSSSVPSTLRHHLEFSRGMRTDVSLVPPIRQTASIFKQPVTVIKNHEGGKVKHDSKYQEKPKQLFWEKRLEGLRACNTAGEEFSKIDLPKSIRGIGPNVYEQTVLQSVATALHVSNQPVTGQTTNKQILQSNTGAYINPDQPLMQSINISEDDIRRQEDRVNIARRRLQEALKG